MGQTANGILDARMRCPECDVELPEAILSRHRRAEHPAEYEAAEAAEAERAAAAKNAPVEEPDNRFTKDGFLKSNRARNNMPSLFPPVLTATPEAPMAPWDREARGLD